MRISSTLRVLLISSAIALTACDVYQPTTTPDYRIKVMQTPDGMVAIPPPCPSYVADITDPYDNQPLPQFGCANARNLALMAERPSDIVNPRDLGPTSGYPAVGSVFRYNNSQTRGLIYPSSSLDTSVDSTTASTASSSISGDVTGQGKPASSSSSGPLSGASSSGGTSASPGP